METWQSTTVLPEAAQAHARMLLRVPVPRLPVPLSVPTHLSSSDARLQDFNGCRGAKYVPPNRDAAASGDRSGESCPPPPPSALLLPPALLRWRGRPASLARTRDMRPAPRTITMRYSERHLIWHDSAPRT